MAPSEQGAGRHVGRVLALFSAAFALVVLVVAILGQMGLPDRAIIALVVALVGLALVVVGFSGRTLAEDEFFLGGRAIPVRFNGLGSAVSSLSLPGIAGLTGAWYDGADGALAATLGYAGGFLLLTVLVAPYFQKSGAATLAEFLGLRFGGRAIRATAAVLTLLFALPPLAGTMAATAGLAAAALSLAPATAAVAVAAMVLASSLFGGMRAVVLVAGAEAVVLLFGLFIPGAAISVREYGIPLPQFAYGYALAATGAEASEAMAGHLLPLHGIGGASLFALGATFALATASLPSLVARSAVTFTAGGARLAGAWTLAVAAAILLTAPALAAFARYAIWRDLVDADADSLPSWVFAYGRQGLVRICGFDPSNIDAFRAACAATIGPGGALRAGDIGLSPDAIVPAFADITDLPVVMSALIAAGVLAAGLAGATALAFTAATSLGHDLYGGVLAPKALPGRRIILTRLALAAIVTGAAWSAGRFGTAALDFGLIVPGLSASAFAPILFLAIWWRRLNRAGAIAGLASGLGITAYYVAATMFRGSPPAGFPGDVSPAAAAVYGVRLGLLVTAGVSLATGAPGAAAERIVDFLRRPGRESRPVPPPPAQSTTESARHA